MGLVTGFFLKHLDSVLKAVASATEIVFTMIAAWALFGTPIHPNDLAAGCLVGLGVALYSRPEPVEEAAYELVATMAPVEEEGRSQARRSV